MITSTSLRVERIPDEFGPQLLCQGELTVANVGTLCDEFDLFARAGHAALILNLTALGLGDVGGSVRLLESLRVLAAAHRNVAIVLEPGLATATLAALELGKIYPVFPSTEEARAWMRGGVESAPAPGSWEDARAETLARWRAVQATITEQAPSELLRQLTSLTGLCEETEAEFRGKAWTEEARCWSCPLFHRLGGEDGNIGCRSAIDPILRDIRRGDLTEAQSKLGHLIQIVDSMPLPNDGWPPPSWVPLPPT